VSPTIRARALTVVPGTPGSGLLEERELAVPEGFLHVEGLLLGICGTDREILAGEYGWAPPGRTRLVLGHESLGRVLRAPRESGFAEGDLAVGIVRHPDPLPCASCAAGEWDACTNGGYTEHGIKELDGFASSQYALDPRHAVRLDPSLGEAGVLLEPASVVAKAWDHVERIGRRSRWEPRRVLVTGAGPIGLLAALLGVARGLEVHVLDRVTDGPKPGLVRDLGAHYHHAPVRELVAEADVILECTGVGSLVADVLGLAAPGGVTCLTGLASAGSVSHLDFAAWNRRMVLGNRVVFGTVNANRSHYEAAAAALGAADAPWLRRLITSRIPLSGWTAALTPGPGEVKAVLDLQG
jgi:threonine dehydrogenase-like Zn-dependent dehydrogenase